MNTETQGTGAPERLSDTALERRVKRWWLNGPYETYVQVTPGLEHIALAEMLRLGLVETDADARLDKGGVTVAAGPDGVMRANLSLRTASRVLLRLGTFPAATPEMLYDRARKLPWEVHIGFNTSYSLHVTARASKLQAGDDVVGTVASAISRHMRELGLYPRPADDSPLELHVRLLNDYCTVSLNTSGDLLHRRGVRTHVHAAPVRETLAAAMVLKGLEGEGAPEIILDPFCGSGTLLLEAADQLTGLQPGRDRSYAFEHAGWFRPGRWREVQREARRHAATQAATTATMPKLRGFDNDPRALAAARLNLVTAAAGSDGRYPGIELEEADSTRLDLDSFGTTHGLILSNLPYGVRLADERTAVDTARRFLVQVAASSTRWRLVLLATPALADSIQQLIDVTEVVRTKNGGLDVVMLMAEAGGA